VPVAGFIYNPGLVVSHAATANKIYLLVVPIGSWFTFSHLGFYVGTADATHNSDVGVYNSAGTLIANVGATTYSGTGFTTAAVAQGTLTEPPGLYGLAFTSVASTFGLDGDNGAGVAVFANGAYGTSAGGALPPSITFPAISPANQTFYLSLF
jgi:hypothetical protein